VHCAALRKPETVVSCSQYNAAPVNVQVIGSSDRSASRKEMPMFTAAHFPKKTAESVEIGKNTDVPGEIQKFEEATKSFSQLAQNEDWLARNFDKLIQSHELNTDDQTTKDPLDDSAIAKIEKHILRCLGAAVIMQWNTIPTKLRRELFDTAGSLGDVLQTGTLRGQIARFLHHYKDQGMPAGGLLEAAIDERKI
jgi:hypothetical protein